MPNRKKKPPERLRAHYQKIEALYKLPGFCNQACIRSKMLNRLILTELFSYFAHSMKTNRLINNINTQRK